jgi:hypothetical protein
VSFLADLFLKTLLPETTAADRLAATLRPDPEARAKRLSQWPRERQQRYLDAAYGVPQSLVRRGLNASLPATLPEGHCPRSALPAFDA